MPVRCSGRAPMPIEASQSWWGRSLRNVPTRLQTLEYSLSDEGGGDTHSHISVSVPPVFRPWIPSPGVPHPTPSL
eukprot:5911967-Pyramimonas_sp.AAC.1